MYSFSLARPGWVEFDSCQSEYDTVLHVYSSDLTVEHASCDDCGRCYDRAVLNSSVLPAGDYLLVIEGYGSSRGQYRVDMNCPPGLVGHCPQLLSRWTLPTAAVS